MKACTILLASLLALGMTGTSLANFAPNTGSILAANIADTAVPSYYTCASIKIPALNYGPFIVYLILAISAIIVAVCSWIAVLLLKHMLKQLSFAKMTLIKKAKNNVGEMEKMDARMPTFQ